MKIKLLQYSRKGVLVVAAMALTLGVAIPGLMGTAAAAQIQTRSIEMSDSTVSATGVKYTVTFNTATAGAIEGVDVDFCGGGASDTPIIGDSNCSIPTGMSLTDVTVGTPTGLNSGTWTATVINSDHTVEVSNSSATTSVSAGTTVSFELGDITNSSTTGTFYARIATFAAATGTGNAGDYTSGTPGSYTDYGGIALSTANNIDITAKVMESLLFCVSDTDLAPATKCSSSVTAPDLTLGHGTPATLDSSVVDTASAYMQTSTNASSGATIRMKSINACTDGGLSSSGGSTCDIPGVTNTGNPIAITAGTAAFGLLVLDSVANTGGSGTVAPATDYNDGTHNNSTDGYYYGMENSGGTSVTSDYGSTIASSTGPLDQVNNQLQFAATASLTTPAGVYTNSEILVATGKF